MTRTAWKAAVLPFVGIGASVQADIIPDRATLNSIVGGAGRTDGFETFNIAQNDAVILEGVTLIDENTVANGQGPGLVNDGARYSAGRLQWNGNQYFGMTTRAIVSNDATITITYDIFVTAMGLDMQAYTGFGDTASISVYDLSDVLIFTTLMNLPADASDVFFGYESANGIARVVLGGTAHTWSPNIDDHTFKVPAPTSAALLTACGFLAHTRRRRA